MRFVYDDGGRKAAGFRGTCDDCAVRAIVIATGLPYRQVYNDLQADMDYYREHGRKSKLRSRLRTDKTFKRGSVRDGVYKEFCRAYIESLGWEWTPTMLIGSGCQVHLRDGELPMGRLIVAVSRHLVAVIDGVVHDLFDSSREGTRCVYGYWKEPPNEQPTDGWMKGEAG